MSEEETWDLETVYDEQIAPLMAQVIAICKAHRIPMIASIAYRGEDITSFCSTHLVFEGRDVEKYEKMRRIMLAGTEY